MLAEIYLHKREICENLACSTKLYNLTIYISLRFIKHMQVVEVSFALFCKDITQQTYN